MRLRRLNSWRRLVLLPVLLLAVLLLVLADSFAFRTDALGNFTFVSASVPNQTISIKA